MVKPMKRLALPLILLLVTPFVAKADQYDPRLDAYFDALYQTEDRTMIQRLETQIWDAWRTQASPDVNELFTLGMGAMEAADFLAAIDYFTKAISLAPDFAEAYNMRATSHFILGNDYESLTDVEVTIDLEPRHFGALLGGAQIAMRAGQAELALEFVEAALALSPNNEMWRIMAERLRDITGTIDL